MVLVYVDPKILLRMGREKMIHKSLIILFCLAFISCGRSYDPRYDEPCVTVMPEYSLHENLYFNFIIEDDTSITFYDIKWKVIFSISPKPSGYVIRKNPMYQKKKPKEE